MRFDTILMLFKALALCASLATPNPADGGEQAPEPPQAPSISPAAYRALKAEVARLQADVTDIKADVADIKAMLANTGCKCGPACQCGQKMAGNAASVSPTATSETVTLYSPSYGCVLCGPAAEYIRSKGYAVNVVTDDTFTGGYPVIEYQGQRVVGYDPSAIDSLLRGLPTVVSPSLTAGYSAPLGYDGPYASEGYEGRRRGPIKKVLRFLTGQPKESSRVSVDRYGRVCVDGVCR